MLALLPFRRRKQNSKFELPFRALVTYVVLNARVVPAGRYSVASFTFARRQTVLFVRPAIQARPLSVGLHFRGFRRFVLPRDQSKVAESTLLYEWCCVVRYHGWMFVVRELVKYELEKILSFCFQALSFDSN